MLSPIQHKQNQLSLASKYPRAPHHAKAMAALLSREGLAGSRTYIWRATAPAALTITSPRPHPHPSVSLELPSA